MHLLAFCQVNVLNEYDDDDDDDGKLLRSRPRPTLCNKCDSRICESHYKTSGIELS